KEITDDICAIRCGFVNFYALRTSEGLVLFDTGMNPPMARRGLSKLGISPDSVTHIFLTHTDYDHAGGLSAFPHAATYISGAEEQMINGTTARRGFLRNKRIENYRTMEDRETALIGSTEIQVVIAPGHTPGSAAYLIGDRYLLSGDMFCISRKGAIIPFPWIMDMNHKQSIRSMEIMRPAILHAQYVLTGHSGAHEIT
ncbi:MAG: MBL fold metallo-hydrolase, partial [Clostridiales bacterium]|nr:MBL fold metallo-hydrolase [Clostridiales bacterium]